MPGKYLAAGGTVALRVLRVAALDALGGARDLVALRRGVVLNVRHAGPLAVLALEPEQCLSAGARRAARLVAAPVVRLDHLLALGATDTLHLQRGDVGGSEVLLLTADVARREGRGTGDGCRATARGQDRRREADNRDERCDLLQGQPPCS